MSKIDALKALSLSAYRQRCESGGMSSLAIELGYANSGALGNAAEALWGKESRGTKKGRNGDSTSKTLLSKSVGECLAALAKVGKVSSVPDLNIEISSGFYGPNPEVCKIFARLMDTPDAVVSVLTASISDVEWVKMGVMTPAMREKAEKAELERLDSIRAARNLLKGEGYFIARHDELWDEIIRICVAIPDDLHQRIEARKVEIAAELAAQEESRRIEALEEAAKKAADEEAARLAAMTVEERIAAQAEKLVAQKLALLQAEYEKKLAAIQDNAKPANAKPESEIE